MRKANFFMLCIPLLWCITSTIECTNPIIRRAKETEIEWINKKYDEVGFCHSIFANEIIVIAEIEGVSAGLGRLVKVDEYAWELGGIYVFSEYRGQKVATAIVEYLLDVVPAFNVIYCIPFQHLSHFYQKFGFEKLNNVCAIPSKVLEKYKWCKHVYVDYVDLLVSYNKRKIDKYIVY
jgi:GNAT superfamily N-acetyltransferase